MAGPENHPRQLEAGGFLSRSLRRVAETAGNVALLSVAIVATIGAFSEVLYDFDDSLAHPLDGDFE